MKLAILALFLTLSFVSGLPTIQNVSADDIFGEDAVTLTQPALRKYEYTGANLTYFAYNINPDAATSDDDWVIFFYTYSGSDVIQVERQVGVYDDRAVLF